MDDLDLVWGFVLGLGAAFVLGSIFRRILLASKRAGAYRRKQTIPLETKLTPIEVVQDSVRGAMGCLGWIVVLVLFGVAAVFVMRVVFGMG